MGTLLPCPICGSPTRNGICPQCAFASALGDALATPSDLSPSLSSSIAPAGYELLHELGRGGSAIVWLARDHRLNRLVALKLIPTSADPRLAQRLVREGQAIARLRHPHIVMIHTLGSGDAQSYLAMDFLEGGDLRKKLGGRPLPPREAADLVRKLADALAHAHAVGLLHRDIKPSNVLLDARGEPQLADFGLAVPLDGHGDLTSPGQIAGTAAYLAPELLVGVDRASPLSDQYSLGAVFYECLTGRPPFVGESSAAILAQLLAADPPPPRLLQPGIPRDAETICLKCLDKNPSGRYASAEALRDDFARFLRGEPIAARPVGTLEKWARWCRRRPTTAGLAVFAAVLLLCLAIGGPLVAVQLARAQAQAAAEAASSRAVSNFLQNDLLGQAAPDQQPDRELKLRTVLDRAAKHIEGRFNGQPLVEAAIRETLARTYKSLGDFKAAQLHLESALQIHERQDGRESVDTLRLRSELALVLAYQGNYQRAEILETETVASQQRVLGREHANTLRSMGYLGMIFLFEGQWVKAEELCARLLELSRRALGREDLETLSTMNNLATAYRNEGKFANAEGLHIQALEIRRRVQGPEHPETLQSMNNLALVYSNEGKYDEAGAILEEVLSIQKRVLGPEHAASLLAMYNLATTYAYQGKFAQAEALHSETIALRKRVLGPEHPETLRTVARLADVYEGEGRLSEAVASYEYTTEAFRRVLGSTHPFTLQSLDALGHGLCRQGRFAQAEPVLRESLKGRAQTTPDTWQIGVTRGFLGEVLLNLERFEEAEPLLIASDKILKAYAEKIPAPSRSEVGAAAMRIDRLYTAWNRPDKALAWKLSLAEPKADH